MSFQWKYIKSFLYLQALRVSMEEQRQRQEDEQRRALAESDPSAAAAAVSSTGGTTASASVEPNSEEAMLQRALALSTETPVKRPRVRTMFCFHFKNMSNQIVFIICCPFLLLTKPVQ